jgi:hypothetical protein
LGGHGVIDDIRKLLGKDPDGAWRRYQAELANTLRWAEILANHPDLAPAVESQVRGVADGLAPRVDRLRAGGNGVVPEQAAYAFRTLYSSLNPGIDPRTGEPWDYDRASSECICEICGLDFFHHPYDGPTGSSCTASATARS